MKLPAREVAEFIKGRVNRMRTLYPHLYINQHDWDDITQEILIHVAHKWRKHHRGERWVAWVGQITRNQVVNKMRDRITRYRQMPLTFMALRVEQSNIYGDDEIRHESDIPAIEDDVDMMWRGIDQLSGDSRLLVDTLLKCKTWEKTRKKLKKTPWHLMQARNEMVRLVREAI